MRVCHDESDTFRIAVFINLYERFPVAYQLGLAAHLVSRILLLVASTAFLA